MSEQQRDSLLTEYGELQQRLQTAEAGWKYQQARAERAEALLRYVRPILFEAGTTRDQVHGLNFETALGDALDQIDTQYEAAAPAGDQGGE